MTTYCNDQAEEDSGKYFEGVAILMLASFMTAMCCLMGVEGGDVAQVVFAASACLLAHFPYGLLDIGE